jgi:hypothetical protein
LETGYQDYKVTNPRKPQFKIEKPFCKRVGHSGSKGTNRVHEWKYYMLDERRMKKPVDRPCGHHKKKKPAPQTLPEAESPSYS